MSSGSNRPVQSNFDEATLAIMNADILKMSGMHISQPGSRQIESEIESSPRTTSSSRSGTSQMNAREERKRTSDTIDPLIRHRKQSRRTEESTSDTSGALTPDGFPVSLRTKSTQHHDVEMADTTATSATTFKAPKNMQEVMAQAMLHARKTKKFEEGGFQFESLAGHILESSCKHVDDVECLRCKYDSTLTLAELPEMVFPRNTLTIRFQNTGGSIQFNCLDALKMVSDQLPDVKVGASTAWQSTRKDRIQQITEQHKPFDWTYTTHYRGTVEGCRVEETGERIDMERLKRKDAILFNDSITLFEDELADHGTAELTARIRVMDAGYFFVLLRFYMRVDNVLIRVCDTRIVGNYNERHVIREWQLREAKYEQLCHVDPEELLNPDIAWMHLPVIREVVDKVIAVE